MIGLPIPGLSVGIGGEGRDSNPPDGVTHHGQRTGHCLSHQRPLHCYYKLVVNSSTRTTPALAFFATRAKNAGQDRGWSWRSLLCWPLPYELNANKTEEPGEVIAELDQILYKNVSAKQREEWQGN